MVQGKTAGGSLPAVAVTNLSFSVREKQDKEGGRQTVVKLVAFANGGAQAIAALTRLLGDEELLLTTNQGQLDLE